MSQIVTSSPWALLLWASHSISLCSLRFFFLKRSAQANEGKLLSTKDEQSFPQTKPDHCKGLKSYDTQNS